MQTVPAQAPGRQYARCHSFAARQRFLRLGRQAVRICAAPESLVALPENRVGPLGSALLFRILRFECAWIPLKIEDAHKYRALQVHKPLKESRIARTPPARFFAHAV